MDKQTFGTAKFLRAGNRVLSLFSGLMSAMLITYSGYVLYDSFYAQNNAFSSSLVNFRPMIIEDEEAPLSRGTLASINEDYRAWITVYDTNIDYPVMQGPDDVYYSSRDVYKENSLTGSIYLSTANTKDFSDDYNLVYGHHMDNQAMFGGLDNYLKKDYFDSHRNGILVSSDKAYDLEIFAVVETDAYTNIIYSTGPQKDIASLMAYVKGHSVFYDEVVANSATKYFAMSTCSDNRTSGRLVVFAKMSEKPVETVIEEAEAPAATPKPVIIEEDEAPHGLMHFFTPKGLEGRKCWALVNLLCLFLMAYIILPFFHIKAKYRRKSLMESVNEFKNKLFEKDQLDTDEVEEAHKIRLKALEYTDNEPDEDDISAAVEDLNYRPDNFSRKFGAGVVAEVVLLIIAIIVFILTEDMRQPMVLIDRWTLLMVVFVAVQLALDIWLVRYREKREEEEE